MTQKRASPAPELDDDLFEDQDDLDSQTDALGDDNNNQSENHTPSWFVRTYGEQSSDDLAKQYRSETPSLPHETSDDAYALYRKRLDERFRMAQQMADPAFAAEQIPAQHAPTQRVARHVPLPFASRADRDSVRIRKASGNKLKGVNVPLALLLTALACGTGSAGGYFMANPQDLPSLNNISLASLQSLFGLGPDQPKTLTVINKPVMTAELKVADVAGSVNAPIPLDISAETANAGPPIALKISGLPQDAYLTTGKPTSNGEWMLRPEDLQSAQLVVQRSNTSELGLLVTAIDAKTGDMAAPAKTMRVALDLNAVPTPGLQPPPEPAQVSQPVVTVTPVAAQPDQTLPQAVPPPMDILKSEASSFLEKGNMLLKAGDIIAARQFYLQAHELQSPEGTFGVGQTYDPKVFAALNVRGLEPDAAKALEWYGKAAAAGHAGASAELLAPPQ
jgi:hypothetical protein